MRLKSHAVIILFLSILMYSSINACTNLLITPGASRDGSAMLTYTCDGEFHPVLRNYPATDYPEGDSLEITGWRGELYGKIAQVRHTYAVTGLINEHQLTIAETTFSGREELENPQGILHYWDLMKIALMRARTAREAIEVMTSLVAEYGYRSTGESISIADTREVWILEIIGPGPGGKGALWVAVRIPDGYISAHANKARIGTFPLNDEKNCLYSENVISFAIEKRYYEPASGKPFNFSEAYCPATPKNKRYADTRIWSLFRRAAPSLNLSPDYHRSVKNVEPYPLWVKPDKKLSFQDILNLMRDHYEGTDFDMTKGIDAGAHGTPNRWRPITLLVDSVEYAWERPVSTQQTGFSFISQSRHWLPNPIGGVLWYGVDDSYTSCYFPLYCGISDIPKSFTSGTLNRFSWDSAWWIFNLVANYANIRYSYILPEIKEIQQDLENYFMALQPAIEKTALELYKNNPGLLTRYLTDYSVSRGEMVTSRWKELAEHLITKYNDGYIQQEGKRPQELGYPQEWLRKVIEARPEQFKLKQNKDETPESKLID